MGYVMAIDVGTTYTSAAMLDRATGTAAILGLGNRTAQIPSVLYRQPDATFLVGEPAERRGQSDPTHLAREFKRRIGDSVPILIAGIPYSPQALTAQIMRWVLDDATERLTVMTQTASGFDIAEADLKLRGPGEFFGMRQHGLPEFKLADITGEVELLKLTRQDAEAMLQKDAQLRQPSLAALRRELLAQFGDSLALPQIG